MPWYHTTCARITILSVAVSVVVLAAVLWKTRSQVGSSADGDADLGFDVLRGVRAATRVSNMDVFRNHSSFSVLFQSGTFDTRKCAADKRDCQRTAPCRHDSSSSSKCRCRQGFFFKDTQCQVCSVCGPSQYVAAPCSTLSDTICMDVSFPVGILPMNRSHLPDDGTEIAIAHSSNVFVERLIKMDTLETAMYVTNNQQSLDFAWPRISGLDIAVSISDVYLVPDYHDVEAVDDTALFHKMSDHSQKSKAYYNHVQNHYCRHPLPDYYSVQMELIANRTSSAQVVRCDSQDESVAPCPSHYKDGDRFVKWNINSPCPAYLTAKLTPLKAGPNSVVCTEETDILRQLFHRSRPTTQEYMFPSRECELYRQKCDQCLRSSTCPSSRTNNSDSPILDGQCCGLGCYWQTYCKKTFSSDCPPPSVECATGEVNIFSLFPHFDSLDQQFACHLRYVPPQRLYSISYTINIPSVGFNTSSQHFTVASNSRGDHERRISHFDFITAQHDTRIKVANELILIGNHNELKHYQTRLMQPYTIRDLKSAGDFKRERTGPRGNASRAAYVQFEKPFLFSSRSWYKDGCHKNVSQIYPNQTIYKEDFTPVIARKSLIEVEPNTALFSSQVFTYQLYHRDRAPYVKFYIEKGKSVLQYLQGTSARGKLVASSFHTRATWHSDLSAWKLVFSASQDECPTIVSIKIFTKLMTRCVGHFDLLINCPLNFTVTFDLSGDTDDLPDIFVLQVNDSSTSHSIALSLIYPPVVNDVNISKHSGELQSKQLSNHGANGVFNVWIFIIIVVIVMAILLVVNCIFFKYIQKNVKKSVFIVPKTSEGITFKRQEIDKTTTSGLTTLQNKSIISLFVIFYTLYSFMFTFSLGFGIIYLTQSSVWSDITSPKNLGEELLILVNKSLHEVTQFEEQERKRLHTSFMEKTTSCLHHLKSESRKQLLNYQRITKQNIDVVFTKNGTLHYFTNEIQKRNISVYLQHVGDFVTECNKTLTSIVERFHANYYLFVRNTVHNDWLKVPRQIFLHQDGEDPDRKYLSSTQVKQFATWLEIDKAEELFAVQENVFGRMSSIAAPHVSVLDLNFPTLESHLQEIGLEDFHSVNDTYAYTVLDPFFHNLHSFSNETLPADQPDVTDRSKRNVDSFHLDQSLHHSDNDALTSHNSDEQTKFEVYSQISDLDSRSHHYASYKTELHIQNDVDAQNQDNISEVDGDIMDFQKDTSILHLEIDHSSLVDNVASTSEAQSQASDENKFYILIAVFLAFDVVLLAYRVAWLRQQLHAIRHGFPEKIPLDETCKQLLTIQNNCHSSTCNEAFRYYVTSTAASSQPEKETDGSYFKDLPISESNDNTFQRIWNERMNNMEPQMEKQNQKCVVPQQYVYAWRTLRCTLQSHLVWQGSVTFFVIVCVGLLIFCMETCLTPDNLRSLIGGQLAMADVQWHVDTSSEYLKGLATQLTAQLQRLKQQCDSEVEVFTDVYFTTINMQLVLQRYLYPQTSVFSDVLQHLCQQVKGKNCEKLLANHVAGERIVSCNFLPVYAQPFPDLSFSHMDAIVSEKITPLRNLSHHLLLFTASIIVLFACCRLVCQTTAATIKHYLLHTGRLPQLHVYQSEKVYIASTGRHSTTMQRSQSWVDSCESGVYLGETEDTNKEDTS